MRWAYWNIMRVLNREALITLLNIELFCDILVTLFRRKRVSFLSTYIINCFNCGNQPTGSILLCLVTKVRLTSDNKNMT